MDAGKSGRLTEAKNCNLKNMPVDLHRLTDSWLELESDPGVFTLLLEDFGVHGIQVEEIYDLQKPIEGPVYGFIFLFKWIEERRSRRKFLSAEECFVRDEDIVNSMFFAQQVVPNSCATHALLSVLLNCDIINIGETLTNFREYTSNMSPENKGFAIGNSPQLARAHNSHAKPEPQHLHEKSHGLSTAGRKMDAFHFVSYVPISGHLFELDGLRPFPIDHGPWKSGQDWTEKFRYVITERLGIATRGEPYHDIRFNLLAVVPDRRTGYESKLKILKTNRKIVMEALQQLIRQTQPELLNHDRSSTLKSPTPSEGASSSSSAAPPKLPAALDSHNYAKSPLMSSKTSKYNRNTIETSTDDEDENHLFKESKKSPVKDIPVSASPFTPVHVKTTPDFTTPLSIQTQMSPTFSTASSTDTSSEVGSAFNSPTISRDIQVSPSSSKPAHEKEFSDIQKFVCIRVTSKGCSASTEEKTDQKSDATGVKCDEVRPTNPQENVEEKNSELSADDIIEKDNIVEPHKFAPKDLLALLKTLETEIKDCEVNLKDEVDKRKRFKVDDCRRTHNYDQFITTFLSMLSEQNKLAGLIKQHCIVKRRQGVQVGHLKKSSSRSRADRRRRQRSRKRKS